MDKIAKRLARENFVVFNISYSLAPKYHYPAQIEDCRAALLWMRRNADTIKIDSERIGVWGYSAGGHLAALLGVMEGNKSDKVKAVVAGSTPHDLTLYPADESTIKFLGTTFEKDPELFRKASPVFNVSAGDPPMFLYHGTWDRIVDLKHTLDMQQALERAGVMNELHLVKGLGHIPLFLFNSTAVTHGIRFLKQQLQKAK